MVSILSTLSFLGGCSSQHVADVSDSSIRKKSSQHIHVVAQGDTLYSIAWRYGLDYHSLAAFNHIKPPYIIHSAQKIRIDIMPNIANVSGQRPNPNLPAIKPSVSNQKTASGPSGSVDQDKVPTIKRSDIKTKAVVSPTNNAVIQSTLKWQWPATGKLLAVFQGTTGFNKGIDLEGKLGESVIAAAAGQVVYSGSGLRGYGNLLIIKHNEIFLSAYAHNDKLLVKEGDFVKAGQRIADMGLSGTDRVKLHFEIRSEGNPVDPQKYLPKR